MRSTKPTIEYDFGRRGMTEDLLRRAVLALGERGLPTNKLQQELRAYLRAKPVDAVRPRQLMQIITRYVHVQPTDFGEMELKLGTAAARAMIPQAGEIPQLTWDTQDYLDYLDADFGDRYRRELNSLINSMIGDRAEYVRLTAKWLNRAVSTPADVVQYRLRRRKSTHKRPAPV